MMYPKLKVIVFTFSTVIIIIALLLLYGITYRQIKHTLSTADQLRYYNNIELELERLISNLKQAETSQRGYIITNDSSYLIPYNEASTKLNKSFQSLDSLLDNDSVQLKQLDLLYTTVQRHYFLLSQDLAISTNEMDVPDSLKKTRGVGIELMNNSNNLVKEMVLYQEDILSDLEKEHRGHLLVTPLFYLFIVLLSLGLFSISFIKINNDRKKLQKVNDEMKIINQTFVHAEKLADLGNWRLNLQDLTTTYSDNFYNLLGLESKDNIPQLRQFLKFVHPADCYKVLDAFKRAFRQHQLFSISYRVFKKDKNLRYFKSIGRLITDDNNQKYFIGINMDVTDLIITNSLLELKNKKLEIYNADLASFNYVASHDLQAPLRKIQMFISRINEIEKLNLSDQGREYFNRIHASAAHMQILINDLLLFSRTNASNKKFEPVDLNELLSNALEELAVVIEDKKAIITTENLPHIRAIPYQIQQLFINLLSNSLKFIVENTAPIIQIKCEIVTFDQLKYEDSFASDKYYKISFIDNGIGFEREYALKIFHLLFRLHDKSTYNGSGIGLAICKKIVDNHNGYIEADSELNKGSVFSIFLPTNLS